MAKKEYKKKIKFILHPGFIKTGTTTFQQILKKLDVTILAKPSVKQNITPWYLLFKEHLNSDHDKNIKEKVFYSSYLKKKEKFKDYLIKKIKQNKSIII